MKKSLLLLILLFTGSLESSGLDDYSSLLEQPVSTSAEVRGVLHKISDGALYLGAGAALGSVSFLSQLGWRMIQLSCSSSTTGNEYLLLSHLCGSAASDIFSHVFKNSSSAQHAFNKEIPPSQHSWYANQILLSQISTPSNEEKKLLHFLKNRWLAKSTGFFSSMVDWVCPCYGVSIQVNPETTSHYARNPWNKISHTYQKRVDAWKEILPHPRHFPLILTRPFDLKEYLPSYLGAAAAEKVQETVDKLALKMQETHSKIVLDLTHVLPDQMKNPKEWLHAWEAYQVQLFKYCKEHCLNLNKILSIQRVQQDGVGGVRLLPLANVTSEKISRDYRFLLRWISTFGLSANLLELDRCLLPSNDPLSKKSTILPVSFPRYSKNEFVAYLHSFNESWASTHFQKTLMVKGTLKVLQGLLMGLTEEKWEMVSKCPTRSSIVQLSFLKIKEQLKQLAQEGDHPHFFDTASHLEQVHANLSSLLEVFSPFTSADFPAIYRNLLTCIPPSLKPLTSCGIHSSGMTSVAGIFKAVKQALGAAPRVLYGENTYFECIQIAEQISNATSLLEATESDWRQVDLIVAQFNPALKRIDLQPTEYHLERIAEALSKILNAREGKPLTLALDCTLDFIDSPRVGSLLEEFKEAIESGTLNIICYRSGLKFDLFGMDNYCGAPFYMIHNLDSKWLSFDSLLSDPVLQTDRLSLNWFCLAYQSAAPQLELYRKQIFDNTRALLNKIPQRLFDQSSKYRVISFEKSADAAFVDIKVRGAFHQIRGAALVGGCLYLKCMKGGHPIFYRPSLGFYHPNFTMLFSKENTTIRLTLGLDPSQVDLLAECFEIIDTLNGTPLITLRKLLDESCCTSNSKLYCKTPAHALESL